MLSSRQIAVWVAAAAAWSCFPTRVEYQGTVVAGQVAGHAFERHGPPRGSRSLQGVRVQVVNPAKYACAPAPPGSEYHADETDAVGHYVTEGFTAADSENARVDVCFDADGFEHYVVHTKPAEGCTAPKSDGPCYLNIVLKPKPPDADPQR